MRSSRSGCGKNARRMRWGVGRVWLRMTRDEDLATRQRLLWPERVSATPGEELQRAPPSSAYSGQGKERKERRTGKTGDKEEWQRSGWCCAERAEIESPVLTLPGRTLGTAGTKHHINKQASFNWPAAALHVQDPKPVIACVAHLLAQEAPHHC